MENTEEFIKDYDEGLTLAELGKKYGFSYSSVQNKIRRLGLTLRGRGNNHKNKRKIKKVKV